MECITEEFIPIDLRAKLTFNEMLQPIILEIYNVESYVKIDPVIKTCLPQNIASYIINSLTKSKIASPIDFLKVKGNILMTLQNLLERSMFNTLPYAIEDGIRKIVYTREDVINYYEKHLLEYFNKPSNEELMIYTIDNDGMLTEQSVQLTKEEIIGFTLATTNNKFIAGKYKDIYLTSQIADYEKIDVECYINNAVTYRSKLKPEQKEKMPYTIQIQLGPHVTLMNSATTDFISGIILYCNLMAIPNNGEGIIWSSI